MRKGFWIFAFIEVLAFVIATNLITGISIWVSIPIGIFIVIYGIACVNWSLLSPQERQDFELREKKRRREELLITAKPDVLPLRITSTPNLTRRSVDERGNRRR